MQDFELLLAKDQGTFWEILGITYSNAMQVAPDCVLIRASLYTIEDCKKALKDGKKVTLSKEHEYSEVLPNDLVIEEQDELSRYKKMAINEIAARMHQSMITISVLDLMDYLVDYVELLNAGYFITDANREDKYFEVIEASLECEEPEPLANDATFEQEQEYIEKKQKYDNAQHCLNVLEKYLNAYDKLQNLRNMTSIFTDYRKLIENSITADEIDLTMKKYRSAIDNYKIA